MSLEPEKYADIENECYIGLNFNILLFHEV